MKLPVEFLTRLDKILPENVKQSVLESFDRPGAVSFRINTLRSNALEIQEIFKEKEISFQECSWDKTALIVAASCRESLAALTTDGKIYQQSLSSLLPVIVLDPQPEELVLDLCAAPGSKTSQIAARMKNTGEIIAVEAVRNRFYKLKSVLELLGVANVRIKVMDGREYHPRDILFDRVLVDAPCSTEARFKTFEPDSYAYWSARKIKEMAHKQKGLLLNACRLLRPDAVLVYATCTFAPEENEEVVDWLLKKMPPMRVEPVHITSVKSYPAVMEWEGDSFNPQVKNCFRVLPTDLMEGFFMAKLRKEIN